MAELQEKLVIDGVDFTDYIAFGGFKWQRSDIDAQNAGRSIEDAYMYRDRVATKIRLDITCRPLKTVEASRILSAILPEYVSVTYLDPMQNSYVTKEMYSNNNPATFAIQKDGYALWSGITFPLIER